MLSVLRIKNLALVSDLTLQLQPGYNVITGETGAGKSIIIGALNLLLGERADRTLLRAGCDSCAVEAVFDLRHSRAVPASFFEENGLEPCADHQLILKRVFTAAGANRQFVNGSPTTLQVLATLGQELVDMHGPHEHQSLLHPARQLDILDAFAGLAPLRERFADLVRQTRELEAQKAALVVDERAYAQQLDLLRFQVNEINSARLQPEEEERVEQDFKRAGNAARLLEFSQAALDLLGEQDGSLLRQAGELGRTLQTLQRLDPAAAPLLDAHQQAAAAWGELQSALRRYADTLEVEPDRLRQLEERVNLLLALKRKYGATLAAASSHFVVTKRTEGGRTLSEITLLDRARRVQELARMLGGQTDAALRHAGELLRRGAAA